MLSIRCSYAISREIQVDLLSATIVLSFYRPTTYFLCCASSYLTPHHSCQPFTIFTYADSEMAKKSMNSDSSSMIASRLFKELDTLWSVHPQPHHWTKNVLVFYSRSATKEKWSSCLMIWSNFSVTTRNCRSFIILTWAKCYKKWLLSCHSISTNIKSRLQTINHDP